MSITVRQARESDARSIAQYFAEFYSTKPDTVFCRPNGIPENDVLKLVSQSSPKSGKLFLIALSGQDVVGTLTFSRHEKAEMSHGGEFGMSVHPDYRRQGIGASLVRDMEEWAVQNGLEKIHLQVWSNNLGGIALYESTGFHQEGLRRGAIKLCSDEVDIILMAKAVGQQGAQPDAFGAG